MHKMMSRYPRLVYYLLAVSAIVVVSGAGKKW